MWYPDFIRIAKENTISQADNGKWYLEPEWRSIITDDNKQSIQFEGESNPRTIDQIEDSLKLEVERRNTSQDLSPMVMSWLYDVITTTVEPAVMKEETDYIKNVIDFMKLNHKIEEEKTDGKEADK